MDIFDKKNITPMLLYEEEKAFDDKNFLFEIKYDGYRTIIFVEPTKIVIKNRKGMILNENFPELNIIKKTVRNKVIFDGEIVILKNGKPSFNKLQERFLLKNKTKIKYLKVENPVVFICFDILYDNKDLTQLKLIERKKYLEKYNDNEYFVKAKYYLKNGIRLFKAVKQIDLEGIVAKNINSKYLPNTRNKNWIKIKNLKDDDFYIGGYKINDNEGSLASLILGSKEKKEFIYIGNVSIGKNNLDFKIIKKEKQIKNCPFKGFNDKDFIFIKPNLICTVKFIEKTAHNSLRQPVFKNLK